ncbi:MAG: hypothetical protein R3C14_38020 [Caldilineaceae bacterium]
MDRNILAHSRSAFVLLLIILGGFMGNWLGLPAKAQDGPQQASPSAVSIFLPMVTNGATQTPDNPPPDEPPAVEQAGLFALTDWLTYNGDTAVDANGGVHLVFYTSDERHADEARGQPAYYAYCPGPVTACADGSKWTGVVQMDAKVNEIQITLTHDGKPRLLTRTNASSGYDYHYWACDQQCTDGANWAGVYVTNMAGFDPGTAIDPQHSLALDSQDRPRFVYGNGWGNGRPTAVYYAYCDAVDCTEPGSWAEVNIWGPIEYKTTTIDYATLLFAGDQPRVLTRLNYSGLPVSLEYYQCNQACDQRESWSNTTIAHPDGNKQWASWDLALDANGNPRVALYEPAPIDIHVGGKLFYGWCDGDCTGQNAAFQLVQVASGEGQGVDLEIDKQGRTHMIYDAGQRGALGHLWCGSNCTNANSWQRRILETSEQLMAEFAPASPFSCDQIERAWLDAIPSVTFDPEGRIVVAYDVKNVATCYYIDPAHPHDPVITRVERIWWAVRWDYFSQP